MESSVDIRSKRVCWIILCLILIIGTALRIYKLTRQPLWPDEACSFLIAEKSYREIITSGSFGDPHPPIHHLMLRVWMSVFGKSDLSARMFACIFGVLFIPAIYYVGSSLFGRKTGLISAFIASVSWFHVRYSQEVRMYSMLPLFGLLSMYFLYRAATIDSKASWVSYTLCTVLMIYTHYYGVFVALSGFVFFTIYTSTHNLGWRRFIISQCAIAILCLPWLPVVVRHYGEFAPGGAWISPTRLSRISATFEMYSGVTRRAFTSMLLDRTNFAALRVIYYVSYYIFICCFLAGVFSIKKYKNVFIPYIKNNPGLVLLLCYLFVSLAIPMLISIKKPIYLPQRYSIAAWPAFPLIFGLGVSKLRNRYSLSMLLAFIVFVSSISLYWYYFKFSKWYDSRAVASFIDSEAAEDDLIVAVPSWIGLSISYYLGKPLKHVGYPWPNIVESVESEREEKFPREPYFLIDLVNSKLGGSVNKIFLVCLPSTTWFPDMEVVNRLLDENFTKVRSKSYGGIEITIYRVEGSPTGH